MRRHLLRWVGVLVALTPPTQAAAPDLLGGSPRSAALAQADGASREPASAALVSPTAAASDGTSAVVAYGVGLPRFWLRGVRLELPSIRGITFGVQAGAQLGETRIGIAAGGYLPDRGLASVTFRPASEPVFPRYEASTAKSTLDLVAAIGGRLRGAVGVSLGAGTEGPGVNVTLAQDSRGVRSDGALDLSVTYRFAPVLALAFRPDDAFTAALRLRGARSFHTDLNATTGVTFRDNPLSGMTQVRLQGDAAYDPLLIDLGISERFQLPRAWRTTLFFGLRHEHWSAAPSPVATATFDLHLVLRPFERQETFVPPPLRNTLSPRVALEITSPSGVLALRAGYGYQPSPLTAPQGYLTPLLPAYHEGTGGVGWVIHGLPVTLRLDLALGLQVAPERRARKENLTLPWASYTLEGVLPHGMVGLAAE
ncbi:MAG: hypothetical protein RMJ98_01415 [Myxococcales bacterium]|nr:hypothetical protein [Polyangiaceae bacterium]MDW8247946.1 hypothetical protein [Myxococcales bacterium]